MEMKGKERRRKKRKKGGKKEEKEKRQESKKNLRYRRKEKEMKILPIVTKVCGSRERYSMTGPET